MAQAKVEVVKQRQFQEKIVNEEFKIWKRTVPLLYDTIHTIVVDSPAISFQWLPAYRHSEPDSSFSVSYAIATNSLLDSSSIKLASLDLPATLAPDFSRVHPGSTSIAVPDSTVQPRSFSIDRKWKQKSPVTGVKISALGDRILSMHQSGLVRVTKIADEDAPVVEYKYHKQEGTCLEWIDNSQFLSGAKDWQIALWNAAKPSTPMRLFKSHHGSVNGISANKSMPAIFASVSDDFSTQFHDTRTSPLQEPLINVKNAHIQNAIAFHPDIETMYVTAGQDNVVNLYDLRNYKTPYRLLFGHNDSVLGTKWDPHDPSSLVSWAADRRTHIWDLSNLSSDYKYPSSSAGDNPRRRTSRKADPCLAFVHAGHTQTINDVDIHPTIPRLYASVGEDSLVEVWKPKTMVLDEDSAEDASEDIRDESEKQSQDSSDQPIDTEMESVIAEEATANEAQEPKDVPPTINHEATPEPHPTALSGSDVEPQPQDVAPATSAAPPPANFENQPENDIEMEEQP